MTPTLALLGLFVVADILLWVAVAIAPLGGSSRFRVATAAVFLLAIICGNAFGWTATVVVGAIAVWIAAILVGFLPGAAVQ